MGIFQPNLLYFVLCYGFHVVRIGKIWVSPFMGFASGVLQHKTFVRLSGFGPYCDKMQTGKTLDFVDISCQKDDFKFCFIQVLCTR